MRNKFLISFLIFYSILFAQKKDSTLNKWIPSFVAGINISQVSFTNWAKGGDNSLSWTVTGDFGLTFKSEKWMIRNRLTGKFGRTKLGDTDLRTTANEIFMENVFSLNIGWSVNPFISNQFRTQVTVGYNYKVNPAEKIANFFDPGYITQSLGFTYDKAKNIRTRLGIAIQETFTKEFKKYSDDPTTTDIENFKFETGMETVTDAKFQIAENLKWITKLRLFTRFENIDVWDVRWDNTFTGKVNSWLSVKLDFILLYEKAQSLRTQMQQALQLGIVYKFI